MNVVDVAIIAVLGILALAGFKFGFLGPLSRIGGIVIGVFIALQSHSQLAPLLADFIEDDSMRRIVAFGVIVVASFIVARFVAKVIKGTLSALSLGFVDRFAGAGVGLIFGAVILGTGLYLAAGTGPVRSMVSASALAPTVTQASIIGASLPWCDEAVDAVNGQCVNFRQVATGILGESIAEKISGFVDYDLSSITNIVDASLNGRGEELLDLVQDQVGEQIQDAITEQIQDTITGQVQDTITEQVQNSVTEQVQDAVQEQPK